MFEFDKKIFHIFTTHKQNELINNLHTKIEMIKDQNISILTTTTDKIYEPNSYVSSIYNMSIVYSKDELVKVDSMIIKIFSKLLIYFFGGILKLFKIDKNKYINNYMLSTNFFTKEWENIDIKSIEKIALKNAPKHALVLRSVNKVQNPKLYDKLIENGWLNIVSRQVYIFDDWARVEQTTNFKRDKKLLDDCRYLFKKPSCNGEFKKAQEFYEMLYLDKYSIHNIQFQAKYLEQMQENNLIHLRLLYDSKYEKYVGVVGLIGQDGIITAPIVGYDTSHSSKEALYRRIIAYIMIYAKQRNYILNLSSGAPKFKKLRGAKAHIEFMFVKVDHLNIYRRSIWKILWLISNIFYKKILRKFEL